MPSIFFHKLSAIMMGVIAGLLRCGKSCRLRWTNYLRPDLKRGLLSDFEEQMVIDLHAQLGNRFIFPFFFWLWSMDHSFFFIYILCSLPFFLPTTICLGKGYRVFLWVCFENKKKTKTKRPRSKIPENSATPEMNTFFSFLLVWSKIQMNDSFFFLLKN